jgi:hypothetical protein
LSTNKAERLDPIISSTVVRRRVDPLSFAPLQVAAMTLRKNKAAFPAIELTLEEDEC